MKLSMKTLNTVDKAALKVLREKTQYVKIPLRDGVEVDATLHFPKDKTKESWPVVLIRCPYVHNNVLIDALFGPMFTKAGYVLCSVKVRGSQTSDGEWLPLVHEREDGMDVVDWIGEQPWCDGNIGTFGQSYLGFAQWAIMDYDHPMLKTHFISVFGPDLYKMMWHRGMFRQELATMWAYQMMGDHRYNMYMGQDVSNDYFKAYTFLPQTDLGEQFIGEPLPWYKDWTTKPDPKDPYWDDGPLGVIRHLPNDVKRPVYLHGGWWDIMLRQELEGFRMLPEDVRSRSRFLIGPWHHNGMTGGQLKYKNVGNYGMLGSKEAIKWFDHHLKGEPYEDEVGVIQAYCIGEHKWHTCKGALPETKPLEFYFGENTLSESKVRQSGSIAYIFDPADPVESAGGTLIANNRNPNSMNPECSTEQAKVGERDDVISFVSPKLKKSMTLAGSMKVELYVSSDAPATAFTVKVCEIFGGPKGRSFNIRDDITDIRFVDEQTIEDYKPGTVRKLTFEMTDVFWKLQKGSALRVDISSSNFPAYHVHSNTDVVFGEVTEKQIAHQTIYFGGRTATKITLPVVK